MDMAQSTATAAGAAIQLLASSSSSPCDCQCMCPSTGFQLAPNLAVTIARPGLQMSTLQTMTSTAVADQVSPQSLTTQPAATSAMVAQQADLGASTSGAFSIPAVTAVAQMASTVTDPPAPPPVAANATSTTLTANLSSNPASSMAASFNLNTYSLSSAATAPVVLEI